jgi:hypothetical protein
MGSRGKRGSQIIERIVFYTLTKVLGFLFLERRFFFFEEKKQKTFIS